MVEQNDITAEHVAKNCIAFQLRVLNRAVTSVYQEALRPWNVTVSQLNLLVAIKAHGPLGARHLVAPMNMEKSTLSRNLERMRSRGWIASEPDSEARGPSKVLAITEEGERLLESLFPAWQRAQEALEQQLGPELVVSLRRLNQTMRAGS